MSKTVSRFSCKLGAGELWESERRCLTAQRIISKLDSRKRLFLPEDNEVLKITVLCTVA
jgi:hypothetical protein